MGLTLALNHRHRISLTFTSRVGALAPQHVSISSHSSTPTAHSILSGPEQGKGRPRSTADPAPVLRRADSTITRQQTVLAARPSCAIIEETARVFSTLQPDSPEDQELHAWVEQGIRAHERGDIEMATDYFRRAATSTHSQTHPQPLAHFLYGISLRHGWGCRPNERLAFQYLQKSAELALVGIEEQPERKGELVMAIYELAVSFSHGWGVLKSKETAVFFYKVAADLGDPDAQNDLAHCYKSGFGAKKDMHLAAHYYRLAEAQGRGIVGNSWIHKDKYK